MASNVPGETTQLLKRIQQGDQTAEAEFFGLVEKRLRAIARTRLGSEQNHHTLGVTGVVHEALLKMGFDFCGMRGGDHFFCRFSRAVRHFLIDYQRGKQAQQRGGDRQRVPLIDEALAALEKNYDLEMIDLHEALGMLMQIDERAHTVVNMRVFGGYSIEKIAEALGVSPSTVEKSWRYARVWLHQRLHEKTESPGQRGRYVTRYRAREAGQGNLRRGHVKAGR